MYTVVDFAISFNDDGTYAFITYSDSKKLNSIDDIGNFIMMLEKYFETEEACDEKMQQLVKYWIDSKKRGYIIRIWRYKGGYGDFIYSYHIVGYGIDWMSPPSGNMKKLSDSVIKFIKIVEEVLKRLRDETGKGLEDQENRNRANVMIFMSLKSEGMI